MGTWDNQMCTFSLASHVFNIHAGEKAELMVAKQVYMLGRKQKSGSLHTTFMCLFYMEVLLMYKTRVPYQGWPLLIAAGNINVGEQQREKAVPHLLM